MYSTIGRERHPRPHHDDATINAGLNWRSNHYQPDVLTIRPRHPSKLQCYYTVFSLLLVHCFLLLIKKIR